ncbi:MAG: hypothetical protein IJK89_09010 [Clostridia bacterium]|nr:hypothetical protein [Clostridia bacterium]
MKKIILAIFVIVLSAVLLTACGKTEATKQVEALIKAIGSDVGLESEEAISAAQEAYDNLTDEEKDKVGNYKKLEKAKEKYDKLAGLNDYIAQMVDSAGTSFSKDDFDVSGLIGQYEEMVSVYEGLKDDEKAQIVGFDQLEDAVAQLKDYDTAAQEAAAAYVKGFMEVYKGKGYTITAVGCIKQIREDKEYHFFSLTYKDKEGVEHNAYSTARFVGANVINTIIARPDIFFAAEPATEDTDCLKYGNVAIDVEAAVAAAEKMTVDAVPASTAAPETTQAAEETTAEPAAETTTAG